MSNLQAFMVLLSLFCPLAICAIITLSVMSEIKAYFFLKKEQNFRDCWGSLGLDLDKFAPPVFRGYTKETFRNDLEKNGIKSYSLHLNVWGI